MLDMLNGTGLMTCGPQPGFPHGDLRGKASLQGAAPCALAWFWGMQDPEG